MSSSIDGCGIFFIGSHIRSHGNQMLYLWGASCFLYYCNELFWSASPADFPCLGDSAPRYPKLTSWISNMLGSARTHPFQRYTSKKHNPCYSEQPGVAAGAPRCKMSLSPSSYHGPVLMWRHFGAEIGMASSGSRWGLFQAIPYLVHHLQAERMVQWHEGRRGEDAGGGEWRGRGMRKGEAEGCQAPTATGSFLSFFVRPSKTATISPGSTSRSSR